MSINQNGPRANCAIILLIKEKKSIKAKIPSTLFAKVAVVKAKGPTVNDYIDNFINVASSIFFQSAKNQAGYKDCALANDYYLFFILCDFNQVELDILFCTNLPSFYGRYNKDGKKALRNVFQSVYHHIKCKLIINTITKANIWLEIFIENNYHDKYHLAQ